jgi:hypothetical protein
VFVVAALTPWASFGTNAMDSQPWPMLLALVFLGLLMGRARLPGGGEIVLAAIALGFFWSLLHTQAMLSAISARSLATYLTFSLVLVAFYSYVQRYGFPLRALIVMNLLWLLVGVSELFNPALAELISATRTTRGRGVTSMAPEPTYFAIYLFFSSWLMLTAQPFRPSRGVRLLVLVNLAAIIVLALSALGILLILLAVLVSLVTTLCIAVARGRIRPRAIAVAVAGVLLLGLGWPALTGLIEDTRVAVLFEQARAVPVLELAHRDASINQRLEAPILALHGAQHNLLRPGGFDTFLAVRDQVAGAYDGFFWHPTRSERIMSWLGAFVYELGAPGVMALLVLLYMTHGGTVRLAEQGLLLMVLVHAIPVAFPLVPMLLATWCYQRAEQRHTRATPDVLDGA